MIEEPKAVARNTDPETSWEAAFSVTGIRESQWLVWLVLLKNGAMTDEEIFPILLDEHRAYFDKPISESGARTRRSELVRLGMVKFANDWKKTKAGRRTRVWRALSLAEVRAGQTPEQLRLIA